MTEIGVAENGLMEGIVVRAHGKWFTVEVPGQGVSPGKALTKPAWVGSVTVCHRAQHR